MRSCAVVAMIALIGSGCGPSVRSASFAGFPPRPADHPILLFSSKLPACPYEEVGLVRVGKGRGFNSMEDMLQALRQRARDMGGDAVVGLGQTQTVEGGTVTGNVVSVSTSEGLAGTVIRFSDGECTRE